MFPKSILELNKLPINKAARIHLAAIEEPDPTQMYLMQLARGAVQVLGMEGVRAEHKRADLLEFLDLLDQMEPEVLLDLFLRGPKASPDYPQTPFVTAQELEEASGPKEAARIVFLALLDLMSALEEYAGE